MRISLTEAGKRFNREWIFRKMTHVFEPGGRYAITGSNGSGKSTLLQVIAGALAPSEGTIHYFIAPDNALSTISQAASDIPPEDFFKQVAYCAPYLELIEEMTALEFLDFHRSFKPFLQNHSPESILEELGLSGASHKQIRYFSSGMKQRVKIAQAVYAQAPVLLLDEPCTNLDQAGIHLYHSLVGKYCQDKLVIVSSNDAQEYAFCNNILNMSDFKPGKAF